MKRNLFIKIMISVAICLLTASFSVSVFAADGEWTNYTGDAVTAPDGSVYNAYDVPAGFKLNLWNRKDLQYSFWSDSARISSFGKDEKVVIANYDYERYFTPDSYKETLDAYFAGNGGEYFLSDRSLSIGAPFAEVAAIRTRYNNDQKVSVDVTTLKNAFSARAIRVDESYNFSYIEGEFYYFESDDVIYYVDFDALSNNAFDADGNLSYRSGEIEMLKLSDNEKTDYFNARTTFSNFKYMLFGEEQDSGDDYYGGGYGCNRSYSAYGWNVFRTGLFCIAVPLTVTVWTAVLLIRKRNDDYKRLFFVLVPAALWLITGIVLLFLIL